LTPKVGVVRTVSIILQRPGAGSPTLHKLVMQPDKLLPALELYSIKLQNKKKEIERYTKPKHLHTQVRKKT